MADDDLGPDGRFARFFPYLDVYVEFTVSEGQVKHLDFSTEAVPDASETHWLLDRIEAYLTGTVIDDFDDIDIDLGGEEADRSILGAVRTLKYGEAITVEELVGRIDGLDAANSEAHDRVREVLDDNPIPLLIPDHRIRDAPSGAPPFIEQRLRSLERNVT